MLNRPDDDACQSAHEAVLPPKERPGFRERQGGSGTLLRMRSLRLGLHSPPYTRRNAIIVETSVLGQISGFVARG